MSAFDPRQVDIKDRPVEFWPRKKPVAESEQIFEVRLELRHLKCPACAKGNMHHQVHGNAGYVAPDLHACDHCGTLLRLRTEGPYPRRIEILIPKEKSDAA